MGGVWKAESAQKKTAYKNAWIAKKSMQINLYTVFHCSAFNTLSLHFLFICYHKHIYCCVWLFFYLLIMFLMIYLIHIIAFLHFLSFVSLGSLTFLVFAIVWIFFTLLHAFLSYNSNVGLVGMWRMLKPHPKILSCWLFITSSAYVMFNWPRLSKTEF